MIERGVQLRFALAVATFGAGALAAATFAAVVDGDETGSGLVTAEVTPEQAAPPTTVTVTFLNRSRASLTYSPSLGHVQRWTGNTWTAASSHAQYIAVAPVARELAPGANDTTALILPADLRPGLHRVVYDMYSETASDQPPARVSVEARFEVLG